MSLQRFTARVAVAACALYFTVVATAGAAVLQVTTTADALAVDGRCALREAISNANLDSAMFTGSGECPAGAGDDTIELAAGTYIITRAGAEEDGNLTGDFDIRNSNLHMRGAGAQTTLIHGGTLDRVFDIAAPFGNGYEVKIEDLAVVGGLLPASAVTPAPGVGSGAGAGVRVLGAALTMRRCAISFNQSAAGLGSANGSDGGGLLAAFARVVLEDCVVSANRAGAAAPNSGSIGGSGGGMYLFFSETTLSRVRIDSNATGSGNPQSGPAGGGGGIAVAHGMLRIDHATIAGNTVGSGGVADGGGISAFNVVFTAEASSFIDNEAGRGGGVAIDIDHESTNVATLRNCTFSGNTATSAGGGLYVTRGQPVLRFTTITGNRAPIGGGIAIRDTPAPANTQSSIIAGNVATALDADCSAIEVGINISAGHNVFGIDSGCGATASDQSTSDAGLMPLLDGPVALHALRSDSPALDAAFCGSGGPVTDQRGVLRPYEIATITNLGDGCDAGAYEWQGDAVFADGFD